MQKLPSVSIRVNLADTARAAGAVAAVASMRTRPEMLQSLTASLLELAAIAQEERFTGQGPFPVEQKKLGVRTGRLRRDLHAEPAVFTDTGIRGRIGSAVEYFAAHELGFDGTVEVKSHIRSRYTVKSRNYSVLEQSVRAHRRHLRVPKREPLMSAIRDHSARIFQAAIQRAARAILIAERSLP